MNRFALVLAFLSSSTLAAADWPQWRGPDRTNVSNEKGLLASWPKEGPALDWKAVNLGEGVSPPAIADGRVIVTGYRGEDEFCTAVNEKDGKEIWSVKIGPAVKEIALMRHLSQRTPTVGGGRVYVVTAFGAYVTLEAATGRELWRKEVTKDFGAKKHTFGFCDYPLVDGDRLIVTPGGETATMAALDAKTGAVIWTCAVPGGGIHGHTILMPLEVAGVKQYVNHTSAIMIGVAASDGKLLWRYESMKTRTATSHAPLIRGDTLFYASGYGTGHVMLKVEKTALGWSPKEVYRLSNFSYNGWLGSTTQVGDHIYVNAPDGLRRQDWTTGDIVWKHPTGRMTYTVAGGQFYIWTQVGTMLLATPDDKGLKPAGEFKPFEPLASKFGVTFPVVANARLYIRDEGTLHAYTLRDPDVKEKKVPDAVYIPTPPDVVKAMLDLAKVNKDDLLYDLGSGDGRIVIAAAKTFSCKAVGVEIDKELVTASRADAKEAGVQDLVTFKQGDLFDADFSKASVVALYILPTMSQKLIPQFDKLKAGSRIVSHAFAIPGIKPDKELKITSTEDDVERPVYLYTVPLTRVENKRP